MEPELNLSYASLNRASMGRMRHRVGRTPKLCLQDGTPDLQDGTPDLQDGTPRLEDGLLHHKLRFQQ
ncbi:unnamed protein product [Lampetra fluviatilis]